jgi:8-oxo-dGTP diphosphatase
MFNLGAFAAIFDDRDRVLLCHRTDMDFWNLPGGGANSGELPTETVIRETKEETGLEVVVEQLTGVYGKANKDEIIFTFLCCVVGGELTVTNEAQACQYFALHDIPPNTIALHVERIYDAIAGKTEPILRRQSEACAKQFWETLLAARDRHAIESQSLLQ